MASPARDQPAIKREREDEGDQQAHTETPPEQRLPEPGVDRAWNEQDEGVVGDLHDGDRGRVRGEGERERAARRLTVANGRFLLETDGGQITADNVVVATGPFQTPYVPDLAEQIDPDVLQMHSTGYRCPDDVSEGTALVVGGGNTGFQIAEELSTTRSVVLSVGSRQKPLPQRLLGRDLFWWLTKSRLLATTVESRLGRKLQHRDTLIGSSPRRLRRLGVELKPRAVSASGRAVRFSDGSELEVDTVIWATGYRPDYSWIDLPVLDLNGGLRHKRGVTPVPGLFFLGLTWQHTRGSALLGWVKDDAEFIAEQISQRAGAPAQQPG
jgi:putative flavoprotein involved in K+ transport